MQELKEPTVHLHSDVNNRTSGCIVVADKSHDQILAETVFDYLFCTTKPGETLRDRHLERQAKLTGLHCGAVNFVPQGVSQAAACDGITDHIKIGDPCQESQGLYLP